MNTNRRIWGASLLCLGLGLGATACGSSSSGASSAPSGAGSAAAVSTPSAAADPLAGKSVADIVALMRTDMLGLKSVHTVAHGTSGGQSVSLDFHEAPGHGCYGSLSMHGGTINLVVDGSKVWMKMDDATLKSMGLSSGASYHGKYIATSTATGGFGQIANSCNLTSTLAQDMKDSAGLTKGAVTVVDGTPELKLTSADGAAILLTDTAHPYLLSVTNTGADAGTVTFSEFDQPVALTPPPASEVVNLPGA